MRSHVTFLFLVLVLAACRPQHGEMAGPQKHYSFSGEILSLNSQEQTAKINGAAVPGYMEAMTMDYPVRSKTEFATLAVGDKITATLDVSASGDEYSLSNVQKQTRRK